ncbi:glutamine--fructose-6-phosphate transaminase (isomerizing) [Ferroacidibacillus organovorans]|uniref:Glutamine--fructose-6-phosphate aminotransferase [isomerizing] n=1 Tax=Ferroacidibacillus organovorans TaxID=1765683 RepID=A0A162S9Q8_9BACL|nr:glutamine--fructose-6-phosphate transaminase (isomerizing) [Ferroacidibacillus organovorans]KYP79639.1 glutamine--fructose-6-phosphate aminotransferase [Ferroacidibacillus organovorans]OAG94848.1 glutamine--fructose-6-phosphate aminotransferase [Ferroacidibacillus organovorans]OPG17007.1 glutamine--fructose-6-phosphate aminotransferase [Ferroacidibacillus organovorans]
MCGIVGYVGRRQAQDVLLSGLEKLEYRGYDSAGVAIFEDGEVRVEKSVGRLAVLGDALIAHPVRGNQGIGHTRWATHGRPSNENAHPHADCSRAFVVVHNGIIENYQSLREQLMESGHSFASETDTEIVAHLLEEAWTGDLFSTVLAVLPNLRGAYALAIMAKDEPGKLIAVRKQSPLVIGLGDGEQFLASDIPALLEYTRDVYILEDGELAVLEADRVACYDLAGNPVGKEIFNVTWDAVAAEKGGYEHFMLKEIHEQPKAVRDTLSGRIAEDGSAVTLGELDLSEEVVQSIDRIHIVACGTSYHAGLVGKVAIETLARIPVDVEIASEYRYRNPIVTDRTLILVISQSGETADTLAALRNAKMAGNRVMAITNVVGSSAAREADHVLVTWAGPEISVASTKAYTTQLIALYLFATYLGQIKGTLASDERAKLLNALLDLPLKIDEVLKTAPAIETIARDFSSWDDAFFLGRGLDFAVALEGALKYKEISYIHAEAYPAGELKHGTLALITEDVPVIALVTQDELYEKTVSNIKEVKARDAHVLALAWVGDEEIGKSVDRVLYVPRTLPFLAPVLLVAPLQLLAYYASVARGNDVDKPRNLAKSVTVE